ncbi:MAG: hypothetical protein R6U91_01390 [Bacillota bacterium]
MENPKNINLDNVEEHFVKIYKKSNYRNNRNNEEDIKDIDLDSDDSNMKIFLKE